MKPIHRSLRKTSHRTGLFVWLVFLSCSLLSFVRLRSSADDIWQQFGISKQQAGENIRNSFFYGYLDKSGVQNFRNIAAGNRAAVAKDVLTYTKEYLTSAAFVTEYANLRNGAKPQAPEGIAARTKEDIRKEKIAEIEKSIEETEEFIRTTTDSTMKAAMQEALVTLKAALKDYQDPNSTTIDMLYQGGNQESEDDQQQYKIELQNWQTEYPADYRQFIKLKIRHYLDIAGTVDFAAATVDKRGKQYFVNEDYEAKSSEWKMIYRAGKEVYETTKLFGTQWLKEMP